MISNFTKAMTALFALAMIICGGAAANAQTQYRNALDFDGDHKADFTVLRRSASGPLTWYTRSSSNGQMRANAYGLSGFGGSSGNAFDQPMAGDFDGDGKADYTVVRRGQGAHASWFILRSSDNTMSADRFGYAGNYDAPIPADYDGDGKTDMAVRRPEASNSYVVWIQQSSNNQIVSRTQSADVDPSGQVTGCLTQTGVDIDGDGKQDLAQICFNTGSMVWVVKRAADGVTERHYWGRIDGLGNFDEPVPADYDGDGKTDVAVVRYVYPGSGDYYHYYWYIRQSSNGAMRTVQFGLTDFGPVRDITVPADYDGDGKADIAVWRSSEGNLYMLRSGSGNSLQTTQWGLTTDYPLTHYIAYMPSE